MDYKFIGNSVLFIMVDGEDILLKVLEESESVVKGYDDEGLNRTLNKSDISDYLYNGGRYNA